VEVITAEGLRRLAAESRRLAAREHVTGDAGTRPPRWSSLALLAQPGQGEVRWAVDRPADYAFVAAVYDALYPTTAPSPRPTSRRCWPSGRTWRRSAA
jgi:spore coat polysaccharide biosynthesis protein SpsF